MRLAALKREYDPENVFHRGACTVVATWDEAQARLIDLATRATKAEVTDAA